MPEGGGGPRIKAPLGQEEELIEAVVELRGRGGVLRDARGWGGGESENIKFIPLLTLNSITVNLRGGGGRGLIYGLHFVLASY